MFESLKKVGKELNHAWENLAEGWRELLTRSGNALTHFGQPVKRADEEETVFPAALPHWSLLAGEVTETAREVIVRLEAPGMEKEAFDLSIEGNQLLVYGEKHWACESHDERYHLLERAYGSFQRLIPLPGTVDGAAAKASYRNGVLTIKLPKTETTAANKITVS